MNFEIINKLEKNTALRVTVSKAKKINKSEKEIDRGLINDLIKSEQEKEHLKKPFEYFYEDVISELLKFEFEKALGSTVYSKATDDAIACLETCRRFSELTPYKIHGWLLVAFKFIDHFVLHFIQDVRKEVIQKLEKTGDEKSRYIQLTNMKCDVSKAGSMLINLLYLRNKKLEHRTRIRNDGRQELLKPDRKLIYNEVIKYYPEVMKVFLLEYKKNYPTCLTK